MKDRDSINKVNHNNGALLVAKNGKSDTVEIFHHANASIAIFVHYVGELKENQNE